MFYRSLISVLAIAALVAGGARAARAQDQSKYPDWSGQWFRGPGMGTGWDPTRPQGLGQQAPLTPEYQAIFAATLADKAAGGLGGDPTATCLPHGMPRMMIAIYPIEFVITPKTTYMLSDYTTDRRIYTDGRAWPQELLPSFNGYSIGKWSDDDGDGKLDTLAVETRGFKGPRTFEGSGMPLHNDNETVIRERIQLDKTPPAHRPSERMRGPGSGYGFSCRDIEGRLSSVIADDVRHGDTANASDLNEPREPCVTWRHIWS